MRVIAELPHPDFKVSIFSMNQKFIIKCEKGNFEQSYKINEMDLTNGLDGVFEIMDEAFFVTVSKRFEQMHADFTDAFYRFNY